MPFTTLSRGALWSLLLMLLTFGTVQADPIAEVARILDDIRQDQPVPRLGRTPSLLRLRSTILVPQLAQVGRQYSPS